ncbi:MAG: pilus assembly protein PilM, partial [Desulfobacterales bacterium]
TVGCTIEESETVKLGDGSDAMPVDDLKDIVSSVVSDWCVEIKRALDFFLSTYPEEQISRIVLSGGGANIKKFRELLAAETSAEVEVINPFQAVEIDGQRFDASYLEQIAPQAAICMGLATRKLGDK